MSFEEKADVGSSLRLKLELSVRLMVDDMYNSFSSFASGSLRQDVSTRGMNGVRG